MEDIYRRAMGVPHVAEAENRNEELYLLHQTEESGTR